MKNTELYFSSLLFEQYSSSVNLIAALDAHNIPYCFLPNTKDIWLRDFMPVRTGSGRLISFRYEPSYLERHPHLRTDFRRDIAPWLGLPVIYTDINLDGGNVVYAPSYRKVIISDRVYAENPTYAPAALVRKLESLLEAEVIIIPSLKSDMTGHVDGMVRAIGEDTVLCNRPLSPYGFEKRIKAVLRRHGLHTVDFPFVPASGDSAVGCYLNYLETDAALFLPVFGLDADAEAIAAARQIFDKPVEPIMLPEIAAEGGCLNCISWSM